jgi:UDP:flavonoid glycosyltransferase YjiC (YdhE family)
MDRVHAAAFEASRDADLLIYSGLLMGGASIAEKLGIPCAPVFMIPSYPTRELPVPQGELPDTPFLNKAFYGLTLQSSWSMFRGAVNRFRKQQLGLPAAPPSYKQWLGDPKTTVLLNYSQHVLPRPADWPDHIHVCGYWFLPTQPGWTPPAELMNFIDAGPKPIYIGFGSMADRNAESKTRIILDAIARTGQRAILAKGWGGLRLNELPENIFMVDAIPHDWLFERVSMVVHHGGAGTTAAGLRAGIPSVIVPHFADQFFWGRQVHKLGVGPQPIPIQKLTSEKLGNAIQTCLIDTSMQDCARQLSEKIRMENGLHQTQLLLERTFNL